jgi:prepilin-type N-terminal cleavage/methylation domain-containing protein
MRFNRHGRPGFTKTELLVVLVIIGVVIALILPAIAKIDAVSQRDFCKSNLMQIALAVEGYRETYGTYPTGTMPNPNLNPEKRLSWQVEILPFLEWDNLYNEISKDRAWDDEVNRKLKSHPPQYVCSAWGRYHGPGLTHPTEYIGISGVGIDSPELPVDDSRSGFFGYSRTIKKEDIRDGLSCTLLALDTSTDLGPWAAGGPSTVRGIESEKQPFIGPNRQFGGNHKTDRGLFRWISHDCATAAFVDGSVRFLNDSISRETLEALATIAGGDTPGDDY